MASWDIGSPLGWGCRPLLAKFLCQAVDAGRKDWLSLPGPIPSCQSGKPGSPGGWLVEAAPVPTPVPKQGE